MNRQICAAIKSRHHLVFNYDGLPREIEPHAHGTSSRSKEVVRGFQNWRAKLKWPARLAPVGRGEDEIVSCVRVYLHRHPPWLCPR